MISLIIIIVNQAKGKNMTEMGNRKRVKVKKVSAAYMYYVQHKP